MEIKFIEATQQFNWGKFMVMRFTDEEYAVKSEISPTGISWLGGGSLIAQRGWTRDHIFVMDLQTGEGAMFLPNRSIPAAASYDLNKHKIWVCPMYEPFLKWLYEQDLQDLTSLPSVVEFTAEEAPPSMYGYRREGI